MSNIRGTIEVDPDGLEHSLSSFPPNLLCPGEHLNQKGGANCLKLPDKVKESQAWADRVGFPNFQHYLPSLAMRPPAAFPPAKIPLKISAPPVLTKLGQLLVKESRRKPTAHFQKSMREPGSLGEGSP